MGSRGLQSACAHAHSAWCPVTSLPQAQCARAGLRTASGSGLHRCTILANASASRRPESSRQVGLCGRRGAGILCRNANRCVYVAGGAGGRGWARACCLLGRRLARHGWSRPRGVRPRPRLSDWQPAELLTLRHIPRYTVWVLPLHQYATERTSCVHIQAVRTRPDQASRPVAAAGRHQSCRHG